MLFQLIVSVLNNPRVYQEPIPYKILWERLFGLIYRNNFSNPNGLPAMATSGLVGAELHITKCTYCTARGRLGLREGNFT